MSRTAQVDHAAALWHKQVHVQALTMWTREGQSWERTRCSSSLPSPHPRSTICLTPASPITPALETTSVVVCTTVLARGHQEPTEASALQKQRFSANLLRAALQALRPSKLEPKLPASQRCYFNLLAAVVATLLTRSMQQADILLMTASQESGAQKVKR